MEKSKLSFLLDFLFKATLIFFISFIWLRLYIHNNTLILVLSIMITLFLSFLISIFLRKKITKINLSKKEIKEKKEYLNQLNFSTKKDNSNFLASFFREETLTKTKEYFIFIKEEKVSVFNDFSFKTTSIDFLIDCIKECNKKNINKIIIFASTIDKDCFSFIKNLKNIKIKLIDYNNFYINYMKKHNIFPDIKIKYEEKTKYSFKELLNIAFSKKKTKGYVITGFIFLVSSLFLRYNIYYIIFTTIMFVFALFSYFNKPFNKNSSDTF